jgi:hypothetical protein
VLASSRYKQQSALERSRRQLQKPEMPEANRVARRIRTRLRSTSRVAAHLEAYHGSLTQSELRTRGSFGRCDTETHVSLHLLHHSGSCSYGALLSGVAASWARTDNLGPWTSPTQLCSSTATASLLSTLFVSAAPELLSSKLLVRPEMHEFFHHIHCCVLITQVADDSMLTAGELIAHPHSHSQPSA